MQRTSLPLRLLLLPIDLIRTVILALRISLWHARVIARSTLFGSPSVRAFCHPTKLTVGDIRINVCPFARKFASPRLFSILCSYCRLTDRVSLENVPLCRRRGGGPASSMTHICFGVLPILAVLAALFWILRPDASMLEDAQRHLLSPDPASPPAAGPPPASPAPEPPVGSDDLEPPFPGAAEELPRSTLAPMLRPDRSGLHTKSLPPPPMGFSPDERRLITVTPSPPRSDVATARIRRADGVVLLRRARQAAKLGDYASALRLAQESVAKGGGSIEARTLVARSELECGKAKKAFASAEQVLQLDPRVAEAHAILGKVHLEKGEMELAEKRYQQALALDPQSSFARAGLARIMVLRLQKD